MFIYEQNTTKPTQIMKAQTIPLEALGVPIHPLRSPPSISVFPNFLLSYLCKFFF